MFQFYPFLDDDSDLAPSKLRFTCGWVWVWAELQGCTVTPLGCCHRTGVKPAATSPFWGLTVTTTHNKLSKTTEKTFDIALFRGVLTHFFPFWEAYFGIKVGCAPLGINIRRNGFVTIPFTMVVLFLSQKITHHSEG